MKLKKDILNLIIVNIKKYISNKIIILKKRLSFLKKYVPNSLTISRIITTPFIIITFISNNFLLTIILTIYSLSTDFLDGYLSRKWNVTSKTGALLDQIADKLLGIGALFLSIIYVPILVFNLTFEGLIAGINIISKLKGNNPKTLFSGKIKTWALSITLISSIATKFIPELYTLSSILSIITALFQIKATNEYYNDYKNEINKKRVKIENISKKEEIEQNDRQMHHSKKQKAKYIVCSKQDQINYLNTLKHNILHETIKQKTKVKK